MTSARSNRPSVGVDAFAAAALAVLVVLAGCASPIAPATDGSAPRGSTTDATPATATTPGDGNPAATDDGERGGDPTTADGGRDGETTTEGATDDGSGGIGETRSPVAVRGGSLPVNATVVYERVERVLGVNASAPAAVRVTNASAFYGNATGTRTGSVTGHARFERALGLRQPANASALVAPNGVTIDYGTVAVYPGASPTRATVEGLLAHEFAHYVQFTTGSARTLASNLSAPRTTDGAFVRRAITEGVAVAVETAYVRRYLENASTGIDRSRDALDGLPAGSALAHGQLAYVVGYAYLTDRYGTAADAAANASATYANPPQTSEQLLHGTTDAPVPLDVRVDAADSGYRGGVADRLGEVTLRVALANAPGVDAADAAAGWGEDALVVLQRNGTANYAWTIRFDTREDAAHAHRALAALLDARDERTAAALHRPTDRTVVLAVGTPAFVADLAVTGANATVDLALDGTNATSTVSTSSFESTPGRIRRQ